MFKDNAIPKSFICGCAGVVLTDEECRFFAKHNPLGFILFARNIDNPEQVCSLVKALRETVGRENAPVLIDQEGGRVQRLRPPHWRKAPDAAVFGNMENMNDALEAVRINSRLIAYELAELGINVDCLPVLDVRFKGANDIIGDRSFSHNPEIVAKLGKASCDGLLEGEVLPVIKHIPGHGRAMADSHLKLPVVNASRKELEKDFYPFRELNNALWGMTAHIVYTEIDDKAPATISHKVIDLIRNDIGFDGFLIGDDVSMKALKGSFEERSKACLNAGCDAVLHCNGDMKEMQAVASASSYLSDKSMERLNKSLEMIKTPVKPISNDEFDELSSRLESFC